MLEGILRLIRYGDVPNTFQQPAASPPLGTAQALVSESWETPYCTEFILTEVHEDVSNIRESFTELGGDLAVVGWNELVKIHIHTADPERVLACAHSYGSPINVKIDDTRKQHSHIVPASLGTQGMETKKDISVIATAPGDGIRAICMSLGAEFVVVGEQTRNPSVSELTSAIDNAYCDKILLLPNDSNITPAATQAASMSDRQVEIIPSRNISQGLSALIAFRPDADISENVSSMEMALSEVKHGEVARAVRNAQYRDLAVKENDIIGLFDGSVRVAADDYTEAIIGLLRAMVDEDDEIITILYGAEMGRSETEGILEEVESEFSEQEVELHYGGQSYCSYILAVE
ncbi:DAK2 domain-containing protein [Candidatus Poribacteria bacterium]